jgi:tryptophanyl-tRNA synthetase
MRIFSGIRSSGDKTLGNYSGGFRQYVATQEQGDAFFCVVDLHSITTPFEPEVLHEATLSVAGWLFATGLDPDRSTVFVQSHVQARAEAAWLLGAVTSFGELRRMTQFKERSEEQDFVSSGLFNYPVLMAGDILLYEADIVPIGDDQRQHLELARNIAERFNGRFGETFKVPDAVYPEEGARIKNLQEPERLMSTTRGAPAGVVRMIDPPDEVRKKFKTAVTDSGTRCATILEKPGVSNLIEIVAVSPGARSPRWRRGSTARARRVQGGRRRGRRRAARADPGALQRAPRGRGRAAANACSGRGQGTRGECAHPRDDVRAHGLCSALAGGPQDSSPGFSGCASSPAHSISRMCPRWPCSSWRPRRSPGSPG